VNETLILAILLIALLVFDLVTVAARAAFQESTYARLLGLREEFGEQANRVIPLYHTYSRTIASVNFLLVLARFLLAGGCLIIFLHQVPGSAWWISLLVLLLAALVLFLFEHAAAAAVLRDPERNTINFGMYLRFLVTICTPFVALSLALSKDASAQEDTAGSVTEDELKTLVDVGQEEGVIELGERRMIYSVIELGDTLAREIMVPRIDMLTLEVSTPLTEAIDLLLESGHSRVPVFEDTVDNTLGLLYAKDLLRVWREGDQLDSLRSLLRPAYYIPEAKKVNELLTEMQSQRIHMAIVVDEYGGIAGIVTLEDIVEEILGEIRDEYDQAEELPYQLLKNGDYIFLGRIDLDDFNEIMGSHLPKDEADTVGGYIYSRLGHVPEVGETVQDDSLTLVVEQVSSRRIRKVRARWVSPEQQNLEENKHANG
jgi:putative hemolysin